jgi:hypothetical protein
MGHCQTVPTYSFRRAKPPPSGLAFAAGVLIQRQMQALGRFGCGNVTTGQKFPGADSLAAVEGGVGIIVDLQRRPLQ